MAFELNLKFPERLYLSDVSRKSVVCVSIVYSKAPLVLHSLPKRTTQQIVLLVLYL